MGAAARKQDLVASTGRGVGVGSLSDSINLEPSQDLISDRSHKNPQCLLEQATWEVTGFLHHDCLGQHG